MQQTPPLTGSVGPTAVGDCIGRNNKSSTLLEESFPALIGPSLPWKYRQPRPLGRGAWSTVWTLIDNATNEIVVGKLSNLALMSEQNKNFARSEAVNILSCEHPNIIRLLETYEQNGKLLHILEYADAGDLMTQVEVRAKSLSWAENGIVLAGHKGVTGTAPFYYKEKEVLIILAQICLAVKYIHEKKIMHRDLKTSNILLRKNGLIKLGDFGLSQKYTHNLSDVEETFCGTPHYLSPELWRRESYNYKADIWSLGVLLYELMALRKPFICNSMEELMQRVLTEGSYDPLPADRYSQGLRDLCYAMLRVNPHERPNIMEVFETPVLLNGGLEYLKKKSAEVA
ncbi:protein kinase [Trypanosoma rangeli SC58]|uniref:non-specific serine/threonine protein kinase n=1 Tax=Trypanosoma rangeli SC58 TaxID=429131 RepID=A0A061J838_TRYRA|nr:protein kinase [Trypanosoma rangeli SC58]